MYSHMVIIHLRKTYHPPDSGVYRYNRAAAVFTDLLSKSLHRRPAVRAVQPEGISLRLLRRILYIEQLHIVLCLQLPVFVSPDNFARFFLVVVMLYRTLKCDHTGAVLFFVIGNLCLMNVDLLIGLTHSCRTVPSI